MGYPPWRLRDGGLSPGVIEGSETKGETGDQAVAGPKTEFRTGLCPLPCPSRQG